MTEIQPYYVYIVRCADDTLYTGLAKDLAARLDKHNQGQGARYTRGRRPVTLVYYEQLPGKSEALKREMEIKRMTRQVKLNLIRDWQLHQGGDSQSPGSGFPLRWEKEGRNGYDN